MKYNFNEFIICLGYKGHEIISYFKDYNLKNSNITISSNGRIETINSSSKPWKINLIQTGENTQTGGRIKKIANHLKDDEQFFMTYGDGLSNVDHNKLLEFHNNQRKLATITAVRPLARFGALEINKNKVSSFKEKPISESSCDSC
jgi:glucose-1-phosphate cytidylyltransferase